MKLDAAQIAQFEEEGYLLLHGVLTDADLDPVIAEYEQHIDRRAHELLTEGKISKLYADEPFHRRLVSICREC
ncbi:MAG TPA: mitomycin antibiotic biosynthesis protein, partial [Candidatus Handelsmanbacteria bacterium]|nr:mitomycin antibiotic biosynthesis protein [Candidatus Handelsmanbacteria bacterium]